MTGLVRERRAASCVHGGIKAREVMILTSWAFSVFGGIKMAWLQLVIAGLFEVVWATSLKYTEGFTKLYPTIITIVGMIISFYFLSSAIKTLPMGTAYAIWTGIGAVGAVLVGIIAFNEPKDAMRLVFVGCIVVGILGLKITSSE